MGTPWSPPCLTPTRVHLQTLASLLAPDVQLLHSLLPILAPLLDAQACWHACHTCLHDTFAEARQEYHEASFKLQWTFVMLALLCA